MQDKKDWIIKEDPIFDKLNELTLGKIAQIESGSSKKGIELSEDHIKKISEKNKGKKRSEDFCRKNGEFHKGKKRSEESKMRISESKKGKKLSEEQKNKIKNWFNKVGFSEEAKIKMSLSTKGKPRSEETRKKISEGNIKPYAIYNGKEYTTLELSKELGIEKNTIPNIKSGKKKDIWGLKFL